MPDDKQREGIARLRAENAALHERIRELESRLADLEERVRRAPRNSSMPPSAEGLSKPPVPNRAQRRAEKRRQGKQPGDEGKHLAQVADPTEVVVHEPVACPDCGADLSSAEVVGEDNPLGRSSPCDPAHVSMTRKNSSSTDYA